MAVQNNVTKLAALREVKKRELLAVYKDDFALFSREQIKVLPKDNNKGFIPFEFNSAQVKINDALEKQLKDTGKVRAIILKARQQGIGAYGI